MTTITKPMEGGQAAIRVQKPSAMQRTLRYVRENYLLFVLAAPGLFFIFLFSYIPMFGTIIAFQDYSPRTMFLGPWVGFRNFRLLTESPLAMRLIGSLTPSSPLSKPCVAVRANTLQEAPVRRRQAAASYCLNA